ncbi:hypothetical protein [Streptomyces sp. S1D4-20]|uniref:hypothetical protein n=1 Tax=Streptomyces sp. S1D4-20 TaxID=2594462 RepID=UPI001163CABC|nr:hypothetical protein [Streptomyces sp. S1D4-20]QDN54031.1 hypothetical protein FNV67_00160 [Streptomyces sp. S1D4-20]
MRPISRRLARRRLARAAVAAFIANELQWGALRDEILTQLGPLRADAAAEMDRMRRRGLNALRYGLTSDLAPFFAKIQDAEQSAKPLLTPRVIMPARRGPTTGWGKTSLADLAAHRLTALGVRRDGRHPLRRRRWPRPA